MPMANAPKAGNAPIVKLGHTRGTKYGTDPQKKEMGPSNPTEITYGGNYSNSSKS